MLNYHYRLLISCCATTVLCLSTGSTQAQQKVISGAEASYRDAQQGKPLPPKPDSPVAPKPSWTPPASCHGLRPSKIVCDNPKREITVQMYSPVLIMDENALDPARRASRACEEIVARIWNTYVRNNACKPGFGPDRLNAMAKDFVELTVMAGICRQPNPPKTIEELFIQNLDNQWNCFLDGTCLPKTAK